MAPLNVLRNAFGQRSFVTRLAPWAGWLGIALALAVLLSTVFGTMAQAYSLPAAEMQAATATPAPTPTPTGPTATVEEVLEKGLRLAEASPVHLAVRWYGGQQLYPLRLARHCPHTRPAGGGDTLLAGTIGDRHATLSLIS